MSTLFIYHIRFYTYIYTQNLAKTLNENMSAQPGNPGVENGHTLSDVSLSADL